MFEALFLNVGVHKNVFKICSGVPQEQVAKNDRFYFHSGGSAEVGVQAGVMLRGTDGCGFITCVQFLCCFSH